MRIWLINHYAVPPQYYPLARQTYFAKNLMAMGHKVTIISASSVHNSDKNLITDGSRWKRESVDGVDHVYIKCCDYKDNGIKRIYNMCEFAWKLPGVCKKLEKPDAIVSTSMPPMSCAKGIKLAKKFGVPGVAEIADLWPESLIAYQIAGPRNPAVLYLRRLEKWIYKRSDAIVFTMGGGYDYIRDMHWEREISKDKVMHINNGIDLEMFDYNAEHYKISDPDLEDGQTVKVVYTGSLRHANEQIKPVFDAIELMQTQAYARFRFFIYGKGEMQEELERLCKEKHLNNVKMKGYVEKKYIPYILSKCSIAILNCKSHEILRYGGSQNKLFDYLASGISVISGEDNPYSIVRNRNCGIAQDFRTAQELVNALRQLSEHPIDRGYIRSIAKEYDFSVLSKSLLDIINRCLRAKGET